MATIKSFTSLEQSKVLAEILPLESADMNWHELPSTGFFARAFPYKLDNGATEGLFPCWSLAALLDIMPNGIIMNKDSQSGRYHFSSTYIETYVTADNPVDACYEMILKLHERKLL